MIDAGTSRGYTPQVLVWKQGSWWMGPTQAEYDILGIAVVRPDSNIDVWIYSRQSLDPGGGIFVCKV
jgi:hypothetical protein